jgi:transcription antitermination factor NusG
LPQVIEMTEVEQATEGLPATGPSIAAAVPHWHVIYTSPRHEKRVREHLSYHNIECYLPLYSAVHRYKNGCKPLVQLPLFPGYVFVKIGQRGRVLVLEVPGVLSFVGTKAEPAALSDFEIETLRSGLHQKTFAPYRDFVMGEKVRIKAGPLCGIVGALVRTTNCLRVVITLEMIRQSVAVELDASDIEPCGGSS